MSAANAAAIRRRVNNQATPPPAPVATNNSNNQTPQTKNMTLPQFINSLDNRIKTLEENFGNSNNEVKELDSKVIDEYNTRFEILASEIGELKDIILKLQSFTMEVNKSLYDDRIHIMSDDVKVEDNNLIQQIQQGDSTLINQIGESEVNKDVVENQDNITSADLKTMVEQEISSSNDG